MKLFTAIVLMTLATRDTDAFSLCPEKCVCDDEHLAVTCIRAGLDVMPNTLNPLLQTIIYKYNNFPTVDVSIRFVTISRVSGCCKSTAE